MKKFKWLPLLFVMLSAFLVGCGDSSQLKKGEKFIQGKSKYDLKKGESTIEIMGHEQWKYQDEKHGEYAIYDVKETKFKAGQYKVLKVTKSNKHSKLDPWFVKTGEYYVVGMNDNGFSMVKVGRVDRPDLTDWDDFKKDYEDAKDKEAFLKDISDQANLKYTKITEKEEGIE